MMNTPIRGIDVLEKDLEMATTNTYTIALL